ncbi:hypothetical protein FOZ63_025492 [Perkinsus olseni]|uniref:BRCT domain-containing protein n=1 Tax=Perkinsus olseni TaxID=32597 RepID=A0A7J6S9F5_PEROL|nr:hypothetical protein FOZ63_025492 [Perkinsus olseni]
MIDDGKSDAAKRKKPEGKVGPLKREAKLARSKRHADSDEDDEDDRSEAVRKKLEEKASIYEQLMRTAAEGGGGTNGGDDDDLGGDGGRLVNFGSKVRQMDAWQNETERLTPSSSSSNVPESAETSEVQGMDGGIRQVFERNYNPEDREAADAFHAEAEAAQARLRRDEEFPRAVGRREAMKMRLAAARKRRKFSGQQFQQAVDEAMKGEGRRVVGRPYYEKYLSNSSDPRPDIPVIYDDILEGQKVSTTGLPLPQREQISRLLPWMGGYDRRELTEDLDILICGSVDLKNAKYRAAAHDLKAELKLPAFIDECWKLKARPHDERKFALKVFQGMRFCFLGTSTEVRAHFKSVAMSNGAASVESRLEQCDVAVIDDVFNETALEEATRRGVIVAPTAWIEKCSAEGRTVPVEGEFKPQSMREILKQTKIAGKGTTEKSEVGAKRFAARAIE